MVANKLLYICVVILFVSFNFSLSQLVDQDGSTQLRALIGKRCSCGWLLDGCSHVDVRYFEQTSPYLCGMKDTLDSVETTDIPVTEPDPPSELICSVCDCQDNLVNCTSRNISALFELTDWEGLSNFTPLTVDLSQNPLIAITRIAKLPIQVLNLSNCEVTTIEAAAFTYLEDLMTLDLSRNKISTSDLSRKEFLGPITNGAPEPFRQMKDLSLAYNDIHSLPQDVFTYMTTLWTLDLSGNPLGYIDQVTMGALSELINLRTLTLSGCELETLPEGLLRRQRKLKHLDLSDNRFTTIPSVLSEARKLTYLNLDKNAMQDINVTKSISSTTLQELRLSRMSRLQNITAGALGGLLSLEILRISYNPRLTNLDPLFLVSEDEDGVQQWPVLKELYLNNNNLSTINSHILDSWKDLITGDFSSNPYVCDCNNQWMVDVLTPIIANSPNNNTINLMVCKKPAEIRGLTFSQLNNASRTLVCPESGNMSEEPAVSNLAILLGIMIGIIVTFPIVLVLVLLWKKGYLRKCRDDRKQSYPGYDSDENDHL